MGFLQFRDSGQEVEIRQNKRRHRLYNGNGPRHNTGVMPALSLQGYRFPFPVDGFIALKERGYGFECHPKIYVHPVAYPSLNASAVVRFGAAICIEGIIVLATLHANALESASVFKALNGVDRQHCLAKPGVELIEYRLPQSNGNKLTHAADHPPNGVPCWANWSDH